MCRVDDCDPWEFFHAEPRKAAKDHRCTECCRVVAKGETYDYAVGKIDSYFCTYRTCEHCAAAAQWLQTACGGWLYLGVLEELVEHWDEGPYLQSWQLGRLIVGMRRRWAGMSVPDRAAVRASVPEAARA